MFVHKVLEQRLKDEGCFIFLHALTTLVILALESLLVTKNDLKDGSFWSCVGTLITPLFSTCDM